MNAPIIITPAKRRDALRRSLKLFQDGALEAQQLVDMVCADYASYAELVKQPADKVADALDRDARQAHEEHPHDEEAATKALANRIVGSLIDARASARDKRVSAPLAWDGHSIESLRACVSEARAQAADFLSIRFRDPNWIHHEEVWVDTRTARQLLNQLPSDARVFATMLNGQPWLLFVYNGSAGRVKLSSPILPEQRVQRDRLRIAPVTVESSACVPAPQPSPASSPKPERPNPAHKPPTREVTTSPTPASNGFVYSPLAAALRAVRIAT